MKDRTAGVWEAWSCGGPRDRVSRNPLDGSGHREMFPKMLQPGRGKKDGKGTEEMETQAIQIVDAIQEIDAWLKRVVKRDIRAKANNVLFWSLAGLVLWPVAVATLCWTFGLMAMLKEEGVLGTAYKGRVIAARVISVLGTVLFLFYLCLVSLLVLGFIE